MANGIGPFSPLNVKLGGTLGAGLMET